MRFGYACAVMGAATLIASATFVVPAIGAPASPERRVQQRTAPRPIGVFTPAAADPRMAASLARAGALGGTFRFTPAAAVRGNNRAITVAVRSGNTRREQAERGVAQAPTASVGIAPVAYNLGVSVGWRRFALSGDVRSIDTGVQPGSREKVDLGVSYNAPRWTARLQAERDEPRAGTPRLVEDAESYSVDLGGSYRLTRNLDVTAGVRYRSERDRLELSADSRRDSQAVYVGTAFRF